MYVLGFLPLLSLLLICLAIFRHRSAAGDPDSASYAFLSGSALWGALLIVATETLNLAQGLAFVPVLAFWMATAIASAAFYAAALKKHPSPRVWTWPEYSPVQKLLMGAIVGFTVTIGVVAFIAPPNTWDSMDYHMPRVLYWIQNRTVDFYPTHFGPQNQMCPGAEYVFTHFQLLSGSDRFANFAQWYAMIGCLVASGILCRRFGLGRTAVLCAALFIATIPMGLLEASSTYNDYLMTFWVMSFACFTLRADDSGCGKWISYLLPGICLGLALLTKATAYLYAAPFLIRFVVLEIRRCRFAAATPLATCAALTLFLNAGHYLRCCDLYGNPLGVMVNVINRDKNITDRFSNEIFTPRALVSNLMRNAAAHYQRTLSVRINLAVEEGVVRLHELLGSEVNDPRTTFMERKFRSPLNQLALKDQKAKVNFRSDEGISNPIHFSLIVLVLGTLLCRKSLRGREGLVGYALCCTAGFLLFCGYLKWQDWHSRLHLSFFVGSAPFVAAALFEPDDNRIGAILRVGTLILLVGLAMPPLIFSCQRPLLGDRSMLTMSRNERFFWSPYIPKEPFLNAQRFLKNQPVKEIGFVGADWEYPMMVLLKQDHPHVRFLAVNVANHSNVKYGLKPFRDFRPDAIIALERSKKKHLQTEIMHEGRVFGLRSQEGYIAVYLPDSEPKQGRAEGNP